MTDKEIKQREAQMAQLLVLQTCVIYQQTVIASGIYKTRDVLIDGCMLSEKELLNDEIKIMHRVIERMQEIQYDLIPSEND